nr:hypothetical protein [Oscillochloris trichoides]
MQPLFTSAWTHGRGQNGSRPDAILADPESVQQWAISDLPIIHRTLLGQRTDESNWRDEEVGWGLILPYDPALSRAKLQTADDAPEPIRALVQQRRGVILRYDRTKPEYLFDPRIDPPLSITSSPLGMARGCIPFYILIYGSPDALPWGLQTHLSIGRAVGRLDLVGTALENYVAALMNDWRDQHADPQQIVSWSVDFGGSDITSLMREVLVKLLLKRLRNNDTQHELHIHEIGGDEPATGAALLQRLSLTKPGLVITTSHGQTEPLDRPDFMRATLGLPVDQGMRVVQPSDLLAVWEPGGAIWYQHSCCSAGCRAESVFRYLFNPNHGIGKVLTKLENVGECTAPLPRALLGAKRPLRAFIGHVEPTFNVTLAYHDPFEQTTQQTTQDIIKAIADGLYCQAALPLGLALQQTWFRYSSKYYYGHQQALRSLRQYGNKTPSEPLVMHALLMRLIAEDRSAMVILGDPTVTRPALPSEQR